MNYSDIYGQPELVASLQANMQTGRAVHAYLFIGPYGTGKKSLSFICARALLCSGQNKPCDVCPQCKRVLNGTHPDFLFIEPEKSIGVDEIRELIQKISTKAYEGGRRVVIIDRADKMTPQAQNALLKTLETPPEHVVFFLLSSNHSRLLPTILSRCSVVRLELLSRDVLVQALAGKGITGERAQLLARLSGGSLGKALDMNEDEEFWKLRSRVYETLEALRTPADVAACALKLRDEKENSELVLNIIEDWARDLLLAQNSDTLDISPHLSGQSTDILFPMEDNQQLSAENILPCVFEARRRLSSNVAWQSVLEVLFLDILGG